jgi:hypothetical protein
MERLFERPAHELRTGARERAERLPTTEAHFRALFDVYAERLASRSRV